MLSLIADGAPRSAAPISSTYKAYKGLEKKKKKRYLTLFKWFVILAVAKTTF